MGEQLTWNDLPRLTFISVRMVGLVRRAHHRKLRHSMHRSVSPSPCIPFWSFELVIVPGLLLGSGTATITVWLLASLI